MKFRLLTTAVLFLLLLGCTKENDTGSDSKSWKTLAPLPTARHDFGLVECNNLLYAIGGYNADGLNKVEAYDPSSDKWTTKAAMPTGRAYLVVATVGNKIYAIGGITGGDLNNVSYLKNTEEYNPASDSWTEKSPIPITAIPFNSVLGNFFLTGAAINGKIYVAVGYTEGDIPTYIYDPATDTWTTGKSISNFNLEPYYSAASDNDLYVTNGDHLLQYVTSDDSWRELPLPTDPAYNMCLSFYNGNLYGIGGLQPGVDNPSDLADLQIFDPATSTWSMGSLLNKARNAAAAVVYNDSLYVAGGAAIQPNFSNIPIADFEVYSLK